MQFDEVYDHIGHFGWYQLLIYLLCGFIAIAHGYQISAMIFLGMDQGHFCKIPQLANLSYEQQLNIAIPKAGDSYSECDMYDLPWEDYSLGDFLSWDRTVMTANASSVPCNQWNYVRTTLTSTVVTEFNLVCGNSWYIQLASTAYIGGAFVSSLFSGIISDRFGRQKTTVTGTFLHPAMALAVAYSPNMPVFCVFRFFTGLLTNTAFLGGYIMVTETVGKKYRTYATFAYSATFSVGVIGYTLEAYFVRDHRQLQLVMAIPMFATVLYFWVMPESARWLHAKGRSEEAEEILKLAADVNGKQLPPDFKLDNVEKKEAGSHRGVLDLFRFSVFRKTTFINFYIWFSSNLMFYGIGLNVGSLVGNIFLNSFLTYFADIPANIIIAFVAQRYGRRKVLCASFLIGSLSNLAIVPLMVTRGLDWLTVTFTVIGRAGASGAYSSTYLITAELYPTEIRHVALGSCSTCARVAGMLAPYVGSPLASLWMPLPSLIFGILGLMAAVCVLMLRETLNKTLPDKVEDVLNLYRNKQEVPDMTHVPTGQINLAFAIEDNTDYLCRQFTTSV